MANSRSWAKIVKDYEIIEHDFIKSPFELTAAQIKKSVQKFKKTTEKEVRILCKQDSREDRPKVFIDNDLFILPINNGTYNIIRGEGYIDIPEIETETKIYKSKLDFKLDTSDVGDSEMQHLDYAYAVSLIRTFVNDPSLVLTVRGRKYTPEFSFKVNDQFIQTKSVQTEVDAGYEGKKNVVLLEAKNSKTKNVIIRQLFYPFRQWQYYTNKKVLTLFFEKSKVDGTYAIWAFEFKNPNDYNSICLTKSERYKIV